HGVPGAFMTLIASTTLNKAIEQIGPNDPARLLGSVNRSIKQMLGQTQGQIQGQDPTTGSDDGMDAACFWFDKNTRQIFFAGAKAALFVLHPGQAGVEMLDGDRKGVGYVDSDFDFAWQNRHVQLQRGSLLFATTDGLIDQIGGAKALAFGKRRIRDILIAHRDAPAADINRAMQLELRQWQGEQARRDDVTFFCIRV
ncbi:MAG: SpoIIE family protein phosphatase, partial [Paucibacter sp.]|nr:SpoIIE family protein phosphatase [Roseateles sp.]